MVAVRITTNTKSFQNRMGQRFRRLKRTDIFHKKVVIGWFAWVQENFNVEGAKAEGSKWQALASSTVRRRRTGRGRGNPMILQDSGDLRKKWDLISNKSFGRLKSKVSYSGDHQNGIGVPKRTILPNEQQALDVVRPILKSHVKKAIK